MLKSTSFLLSRGDTIFDKKKKKKEKEKKSDVKIHVRFSTGIHLVLCEPALS